MNSRLPTFANGHGRKAGKTVGETSRGAANDVWCNALSVGAQIVHYLTALRRLTLLFIGILMAFVVVFTSAQLAITVIKEIVNPPHLTLSLANLFQIMGTFALVLIAVELFETTLKSYWVDVNHAEMMVRVAIIAAARRAP